MDVFLLKILLGCIVKIFENFDVNKYQKFWQKFSTFWQFWRQNHQDETFEVKIYQIGQNSGEKKAKKFSFWSVTRILSEFGK